MGSEPQRLDYDASEEGTQPSDHPLPEMVGSLLKKARMAQNKKIPAVSRELKISESYIDALEAGDVAGMPERVYTLGFVRTYATYLGLDAHAVVERFKNETIGFAPATRSYTVPESFSPQKGPSRSILNTSMLLFVVLGGGWLIYHFGYNQLSQPQEEMVVEGAPTPEAQISGTLDQPAQATDPSAPVVSASEELHEPPHPILSQEAEDFAKMLPPELSGSAAVVSDPSVGAPTLEESSVVSPHAQMSMPVEAVVQAGLDPQVPTPNSVISQTYEKPTLLFDQDSWIQIRNAQGKVVFRRLFQAGQTYILPTQPGFTLRLGNAGGVRFALENRQSAPLGQTGQILDQVLLDPATIEGYLNRH